jgi:hypothetical protein
MKAQDIPRKPPKRNWARRTISIDFDTDRLMKQHSEVNWSRVAENAFIETLKLLGALDK